MHFLQKGRARALFRQINWKLTTPNRHTRYAARRRKPRNCDKIRFAARTRRSNSLYNIRANIIRTTLWMRLACWNSLAVMTKKFNTIAEGFDRVEEMRISKPPEKKEKKLTVEERAALFYENQHEAELTIARLKREASIVIQAETRKTKKKIKVIDKALKSSNRESAMAQAFYQALQEDFGADHVMNDESDDESEDDGNCEPVEQFVEELSKPEEEILLEKRRLQDAVAAQGYLSSDLSEESEMGELSSEEDIDTATNPLYSSVNQIDKMKLYRPKYTRNSY